MKKTIDFYATSSVEDVLLSQAREKCKWKIQLWAVRWMVRFLLPDSMREQPAQLLATVHKNQVIGEVTLEFTAPNPYDVGLPPASVEMQP